MFIEYFSQSNADQTVQEIMISAISAQHLPPSKTLSHQSVWVGAGHGIEVLVPSITDLPHWQWSVQHKM